MRTPPRQVAPRELKLKSYEMSRESLSRRFQEVICDPKLSAPVQSMFSGVNLVAYATPGFPQFPRIVYVIAREIHIRVA